MLRFLVVGTDISGSGVRKLQQVGSVSLSTIFSLPKTVYANVSLSYSLSLFANDNLVKLQREGPHSCK